MKEMNERPPESGPAGAKRSRRRDAIFALVTLALVLGLCEALLRAADFRFAPVPILVDTTWGHEQVEAMNKNTGGNVFQRDDLLFWSLIPGARLDVREVNELGLLNGPVATPKPAGTYRVLCLGDSCTFIGPVAYPMVLQKRLDAAARRDRRFEVINAGVASYTSLQGLRLFRERLAVVEPDLVTVYYGWNDHYLTAAYPDKVLRNRAARAPATVRVLRHLCLYQFVQRIVHTAQMQRIAEMREGRRLVRVAPEDYHDNLCAIVDLVRERGARPLLLSAPSNHKLGHVPAFFVKHGLAESEEALIVRHRRYNEMVRKVAEKKNVELLDLEAVFDQRNKDELFHSDGVHPNMRGLRLIGELLLEHLGEMGILSPEDRRLITEKPAYDSIAPHLLRSHIEFLDEPLHAFVGRPFELAVRATNTGDTLWLAHSEVDLTFWLPHSEVGLGQVRLGVIVYDTQGRRLLEKKRASLPRHVSPGETVEVRWTLGPFEKVGHYILEVDPVAELITWFNEAGDERTTTVLLVEPPKRDGNAGP